MGDTQTLGRSFVFVSVPANAVGTCVPNWGGGQIVTHQIEFPREIIFATWFLTTISERCDHWAHAQSDRIGSALFTATLHAVALGERISLILALLLMAFADFLSGLSGNRRDNKKSQYGDVQNVGGWPTVSSALCQVSCHDDILPSSSHFLALLIHDLPLATLDLWEAACVRRSKWRSSSVLREELCASPQTDPQTVSRLSQPRSGDPTHARNYPWRHSQHSCKSPPFPRFEYTTSSKRFQRFCPVDQRRRSCTPTKDYKPLQHPAYYRRFRRHQR